MCGRYAIYAIAALGLATHGIAGERAQVDLSLQVTVSPRQFSPGSRHVVTLAVHNNGPDVAGTTVPESIIVLEDQFYDADGGAPFAIRDPVVGCRVDKVHADPNVSVSFLFFFDSIAPGETLRCTYGIAMYPEIQDAFPTGWQVYSPNDDDTDPSNNRMDFVFEPAGRAPVSVSALSSPSLWAFGGLILLMPLLFGRKKWTTRS